MKSANLQQDSSYIPSSIAQRDLSEALRRLLLAKEIEHRDIDNLIFDTLMFLCVGEEQPQRKKIAT